MKKAVIAMSGGVDSSVAALLTKNAGYTCGGVMMRFSICSKEDDTADARQVAERLGMPFHLFDLSREFEEKVVRKFIAEYERGATPNPCIECNRHLKFEEIFNRCAPLGYDTLVTGHYARIKYDEGSGRYLLKKGIFTPKDQSYVLYNMTQAQLSRTLFPIGELTKEETRQIAVENGFINSNKPDSQDICFIPDGDYAAFIESYTGKKYAPGDFTDMNGKVLGRHKGIINYTIGQRKGLGLALPASMYVVKKDTTANQVILGFSEDLFKKSITVRDLNWIAFDSPDDGLRASVKIRYNQKETPCTVYNTGDDEVRVEFDEPQRAPAKGQSAVFYDGDMVLGGGKIEE